MCCECDAGTLQSRLAVGFVKTRGTKRCDQAVRTWRNTPAHVQRVTACQPTGRRHQNVVVTSLALRVQTLQNAQRPLVLKMSDRLVAAQRRTYGSQGVIKFTRCIPGPEKLQSPVLVVLCY